MLQYVTIRNYKHSNSLYKLWNSEFKKIFPIDKALYKKKILDNVNLNKDASFVALYDNEPVGFIFIKTWLKESGFFDDSKTAHISLIFVKKEVRHMGIGSDMLNLAITEIKKHHTIEKIEIGNEISGVFPGIPSEINNAPLFFLNKGFVLTDTVVDMIRVLRTGFDSQYDKKDLDIAIATEEEKDYILKLCVDNKLGSEAYIINQYFDNGGTGRRIVVGTKNGKMVAFVRFDEKNTLPFKINSFLKDKKLGSIVAVVVDENYKEEAYEEVMVQATRRYLVQRGCKKVIVLATSDVKFYKQLGFSVLRYYQKYQYKI